MSAISDLKQTYWENATSKTGTLADLELAFLREATGEVDSLADLGMKYYGSWGYDKGTLTDRKYAFLSNLTEENSTISDLEYEFYSGAINSRYRVVRNIIRLPTFEVSETGGWAAYANTTMAVSTVEHHSGTSSLAITATSLNGGVAGNITGVPSAPDYLYGFAGMEYAALWVKAPAGARMRLLLEERKPTSPWDLVGTLAQTLWTASGSWEVARVARQKSDAANIQRLGIQMSDRTGTFYIDDVVQFVVPTPVPALANIDPMTGDSLNWVWDSTPGASTSRGWVKVES